MQPFEVDLTSFSAALTTFFQFTAAMLGRQEGIIAEAHQQQGVLMLSVIMVLVAGFSEAVGQSVVLFVNEVKPRRFVMSILLSAILFLGGYLLWVGSILLVARLLYRVDASLLDVVRAVGLGYAPLLFGFLGLIPYFGVGILTLLYFWAFTAIVSAVSIIMDLTTTQALIVSMGGGLLILRLRATFGRPMVRWARRIRNIAAGKRLDLKIQRAVEQRSLDVFDLPEDRSDYS